jgi:hypothetical protein
MFRSEVLPPFQGTPEIRNFYIHCRWILGPHSLRKPTVEVLAVQAIDVSNENKHVVFADILGHRNRWPESVSKLYL